MDINYQEDDLSISPPKKFVEPQFLNKLVSMTNEDGLVAFNLLCYEKKALKGI
jgi:hypothetical protein